MNDRDVRYQNLRAWMDKYDITFRAIGEHLGLTEGAVRSYLKRTCMPVRYHEKLLPLGFPVDLLPEARDVPRGPKPKQARFPGLEAATTT